MVAREGNRTAAASLFRAVFSDSHLVDFALLNSILCTGLRAVYWNHSLLEPLMEPQLRLAGASLTSALFEIGNELKGTATDFVLLDVQADDTARRSGDA